MRLTLGNQEIEITETQAQKITDAVADILISKDKADSWPKRNDYYFYLDNEFVRKDQWAGWPSDIERQSTGNMFKTEEEAQAYVRYLKALTRVKGSSDWIPDWNDTNKEKWVVVYDHRNSELNTTWVIAKYIGVPVFYGSMESAEQAIKDYKEDFLILAGVK